MRPTEKIRKLQTLMKEKQIDAYLVPSADNHQSEYVGEHFKSRAFLTGFTGSAGTAVITQKEAGLWTDGRYFIQAEQELAGSGITLYKMGNLGVPTVEEYLDTALPNGGVLGFDGRVISMADGKRYGEHFTLEDRYDFIDELWTDRPAMPKDKVFSLAENYSGEPTSSKLARVRAEMKKAGASVHLLITLDDIAWLLNIRGNDVLYTPVILSYAVITLDCLHLFIDEEKLPFDVKDSFAKDKIVLHPYNAVYDFVSKLSADEVVLLDPDRMNYALYRSIPQNVRIVEQMNPCVRMKAMKNPIEVENIRKAHYKDAIAHTKFMYWLKTTLGKEPITELSASDKLESLRAEQDGFLSPSFGPISAYGANAAMCHYSSSEETNCELKERTFFLTDTGGHYLEGSTDITRTVALGEISAEQKLHFTNVLRGNLALAKAKFLYGCTGENLDILARQPLWDLHLDYNHGTGHGVGYLLSIHEDPCRIRWRFVSEDNVLEEGMVLSDEPGLYLEGQYGIRLENELLVCKGTQNEYGQFMHFDVLTFVPFDLDAIDANLLREDEKAHLNAYHKQVYEIVAPHMNEEERAWLKEYTRAI
ncbi:MAG: aminopeptidase P family protein [Faecalimonas sp.]|nr:aminopeptidase P family protein [Faecalimonas sp.]